MHEQLRHLTVLKIKGGECKSLPLQLSTLSECQRPGAMCCLYSMRKRPELVAVELPLLYQYDALCFEVLGALWLSTGLSGSGQAKAGADNLGGNVFDWRSYQSGT